MGTRAKTSGQGRSRKPEDVRSSGMSPGEEEAQKAVDDLEKPLEPELPEERERKFQTPGFSRMRFTWRSKDYPVMRSALDIAESRIVDLYSDAYVLMNEIYEMVRMPEVDQETGEIKTDRHGFPVWKRTPLGGYDEDFTRLTAKQRDDLILKITARSFDWQMRAASLWQEAMTAKGQWQEIFGAAFDAPMSGTIEDRTAYANRNVSEDKYFAIFLSSMSRRADAIVSSMEALALRLRDSLK